MNKELIPDEAIILDGLDEAILGINSDDGSLIYDEETILTILVCRDDMDEEEAYEFYEYNILGLRFDELGPTFLKKI